MDDRLKRKEGESFEVWEARLYRYRKEYNMTSKDICNFLNEQEGKIKGESTRRCGAKKFNNGEDYGFKKGYEKGLKENKQISKNDIAILNHSYDNYKQTKSYKEAIEINKNGTYTSDKLIGIENEDNLKDEDFLLKVHGYDSKVWEIVSARNSIWNTQLKGGKITKLYASKINVKPRKDYHWNIEDINKIFDNLKKESNHIPVKVQEQKNNNQILFVPLADFHFGLLSDTYSNGNDYNMEIAEQLFDELIIDVIENNKNKKYEKIVFVIGNDITNSDNLNSTTTKGTQQQDCAMWFTIVNRVTKLLIQGIDGLINELHAPIDILYVPSNHDLHTTYGVMQTLSAWYKNDKNITVDTSPLPRKYYSYGKNIIALSHDIKIKDALKIVSTEAKDMWSNSKRVILMLAHLHQAMQYEKQGMMEIFRLPTISGYSRWTNNKGYVQTERKNQAFVLDYDKGIVNIQNTILDL